MHGTVNIKFVWSFVQGLTKKRVTLWEHKDWVWLLYLQLLRYGLVNCLTSTCDKTRKKV